MYNNKEIKIAMIGQKRVPSREGGVEVVVTELSTRMSKLGNDVTCYNRGGHHVSGSEYDGEKLKEYKGVKLKTVFTIDKKGMAALTSSFLASIEVAFGKYDIIHYHAEGPCVALLIPHFLGKRCIVTIHGLDHQRNEKWGKFARTYIKLGEKIAARYADEIIVLSKSVQEYFLKEYGRKTTYIPNGVVKPNIRTASIITEKWGLSKDEYILFLGRIVPEKGLQYLINAFKRINTDKKMVIAGGSSDSEEFFNDLRNSAYDDERIIFTGFVEDQLLEELYSNAYIYCLPSDLEGMPLSLLEAMSYGNCCLVSDIPECAEVVEDRAVLFKKSDVNDLSEKLQKLCDDKDLVNQYKTNSSDFICTKYNWDNIVKQTLELYRNV